MITAALAARDVSRTGRLSPALAVRSEPRFRQSRKRALFLHEATLSESEPIYFCFLPDIAMIEQVVTAGHGWDATFLKIVDNVSIALFGITAADTMRTEPMRSPGRPDPAFKVEWERWVEWDEALAPLAAGVSWTERCDYLESLGIDQFDENGNALRCFDLFARQMVVAVRGLDPRAKLTLDGSGKRSGQSVDDWGAALEADARRHKSSRG